MTHGWNGAARAMVVRLSLAVAAGAAMLAVGGCAGPSEGGSSGSVSGRALACDVGSARIIGESRGQITGVAVTPGGRVFVNAPRWFDDGPMQSVMEVLPGGAMRAYPDEHWNSWTPGATDAKATAGSKFVCVQSVHVDAMGRLWVLDPASPKLAGVVAGGPKLVQIDPGTDSVVRTILFDARVARPDSYLNDVRIDVRTETAYISDSGRGGIVVVDLARGQARRVLDGDTRTMAQDIVPVVEGTPLVFADGPKAGTPMRVHCDGIALSPGADYLYWQALTGRRLYRAPTAWLRGTDGRPERLAALVEDLGETVVTDGMEIDSRGNVYFTSLEENAIVVRRIDGALQTLMRSTHLAWPDSLAIRPMGSDGSRDELYVVNSQINRTPWFHKGGAMPVGGYYVLKMRVAR